MVGKRRFKRRFMGSNLEPDGGAEKAEPIIKEGSIHLTVDESPIYVWLEE